MKKMSQQEYKCLTQGEFRDEFEMEVEKITTWDDDRPKPVVRNIRGTKVMSGGFDMSMTEASRRRDELLKNLRQMPEGGWPVQDYGTNSRSPEEAGTFIYDDTQLVNLDQTKRSELESQLQTLEKRMTAKMPEWERMAAQSSAISIKRKLGHKPKQANNSIEPVAESSKKEVTGKVVKLPKEFEARQKLLDAGALTPGDVKQYMDDLNHVPDDEFARAQQNKDYTEQQSKEFAKNFRGSVGEELPEGNVMQQKGRKGVVDVIRNIAGF